MKRLLPYLSVFLIIALLVPANQASAAPTLQDGGAIGEPFSLAARPAIPLMFSGCERVDVAPLNAAYEQSVVELVNQHRLETGLPPLKRVENLDYLARYHAADMAADSYFSHDTYDGQGGITLVCATWTRFSKFVPTTSSRGENIAYGYSSPANVMQAWIASTGHHSNIISSQFTEIGVGYYTSSSGRPYWVQDFDSRAGVYPLVINREAARAATRQVSLYIYGQGTWNEMRLRNDNEPWTAWQPFQASPAWTLPCTTGSHTVSVELRKSGQTSAGASSSDSIILESGSGGMVTLGNLPASLTFLYGQNNGQFNFSSFTFRPLNTASSETASWTVTKSGFESEWLTLSATGGVTPDGLFTASPSNAGGILGVLGDHPGVLILNATSTNAQCPATATVSIPVHLIVVSNLEKSFQPLIRR